MMIINHILCHDNGTPFPFVASPSRGGVISLYDLLIIQCSGGQSAEAAVDWLTGKKSGASARLVIGRDSSVTQLLPFDAVARHTGLSSWLSSGKTNRSSWTDRSPRALRRFGAGAGPTLIGWTVSPQLVDRDRAWDWGK